MRKRARLALWCAAALGVAAGAEAQERSQIAVSGFHHRVSNGFRRTRLRALHR
jgi:hypothetical protein